MRHTAALLLVFVLSIGFLSAQNLQKIDSLESALTRDISDKERVDIYNEIANEYRQDSSKTTAYTTQAIAIAKRINYLEGMSDAYYHRGWAIRTKGNLSEAFATFNQALATAKELYPKGEANAYNGIGSIYRSQGNYSKALEYYLKSLKIKEKIGDKEGMASTYNNIGIIYFNQENYSKTLENYLKSLKIRQELGDESGVASSYNNIGVLYFEQNDYSKALEYHLKSFEIRKKIGDENGIAINYHSIGDTYRELGKYEEAISNNAKSLEVWTKEGNKPYKTYALISMGETYLAQKQYRQAIPYLKQGLSLAQEVGMAENIRESSEHLSKAYEAIGNYELAYQHLGLFKQMTDSLVNLKNTRELTQQTMQYAFDKEKNQIRIETEKQEFIQGQKLRQQKYMTYGFVGAFVFVLGIALWIYRLQQKQRKLNSRLEARRKEITEKATELARSYERSESLLLNILPKETAEELKENGYATTKRFEKATVLFTDFKGFSSITEDLHPEELVANLDYCFRAFDRIVKKHGLEKIKTIGDAYMAAGGIPRSDEDNPRRTVAAALEIVEFMKTWKAEKRAKGEKVWELRIGIHTGPLITGVVGEYKFGYDIWGDTVNLASRMEENGEPGRVNISSTTYAALLETGDADEWRFEYRGKILAKNKGEVDMYFVETAG